MPLAIFRANEWSLLVHRRLYIEKHDLPYMVAPGLLPGLFLAEEQLAQGKQGGSRLANIEKLKLHSNIVRHWGAERVVPAAAESIPADEFWMVGKVM